MGFFGCIPRFIKAHGGWILTGLGVTGFGATVVLTAKKAPVAREALWKAAADKTAEEFPEKEPSEVYCMIDDGDLDPVDLTFWEKVKTAFPIYLPAVLTGTCTVGCMIGAQIFNMRQQAMLIGMYATLATQFDQYRESVRAEYGEEADKRALERSRMKIEELREEIKKLKEENGPYLYGITTLPGVIFEAKPVDIEESLMHFNRNLILKGEADFDELYRFIGVPAEAYDEALASAFGYNEYINEVTYGVRYADFRINSVFTKSGRPINMIQPDIPPYKVSYFNGSGDGVNEETYPDYSDVCRRAFDIAKNFVDDDTLWNRRLTKIIHPVISADSIYYNF